MYERKQDEVAMPRRIGVREFWGNMVGFLREAKSGRSFLITSRNEVLAELHPQSAPQRARRQPGALRGRIRMAPDFDVLQPDVLAVIEGEVN